jgi:phosphoribosylformylglycinamidine (FGAM) synthase-like enzyme
LKTKILVLMEAVSCFVLVKSQSLQAIADVSAADLTGSCKELLADCEMTAVLTLPGVNARGFLVHPVDLLVDVATKE